jgi:flavin-dependent dehydrogenase
MVDCDVAIIGGGPAGSSCAWKLRQAGLDVVVIDRARFPRDKICAGWITPQVLDDLELDPREYREGRTFQPITGFRVGLIDTEDAVETSYARPVSYGIRRCEFDHYLLVRSEARVRDGAAVGSIRRESGRWIVNDAVEAPMLVGAGGHFCPVGRMLNGPSEPAPLITAQEVELAIAACDAPAYATEPERPELYFRRDLSGYGWCFRKQDHLNVGFGRIGSRALRAETSAFVDVLKARRRIPPTASWRLRGHAYLLGGGARRRAVGDGVVLVGDAAGLAYPQSGEGIRPAIESGLLAAEVIAAAAGRYDAGRLERYDRELRARFDTAPLARVLSRAMPTGLAASLAAPLLGLPWFVRHVVLDRWFLRAHDRALTPQ